MATQIPRDLDDLIEDAVKIQLKAVSADQATINPLLAFNVFIGRTLPLTPDEMPGVNLYISTTDPATPGAANVYGIDRVTYNVDLYAKGKDDTTAPGGSAATIADQDAGKRLLYLRSQTRAAITKMLFSNFGLSGRGKIGKKGLGQFTRYLEEDQEAEEKIASGRFTFYIELPYFPLDADFPALEEVTIDAEKYELNYIY